MLTGGMLIGYNHHDRLFGSAYNPNYASYLLVLAIAFLLAELLQAIKKGAEKQIGFSLILLALLSFGVFDTGSRAGFYLHADFIWFVFDQDGQAGVHHRLRSLRRQLAFYFHHDAEKQRHGDFFCNPAGHLEK
ncbi:hypothetical protein QS257_05085 [Terrilactibacillus sp. S3-3]|nr:hypothetical protein QS257_05085 [Terrilactibacillus sp. S3-3]